MTSGAGYGNINTVNGGMTRLLTGFAPTFSCPDNNDMFTERSFTGNGALTHPVGFITGDETSYAGVVAMIVNATSYLHTGQTYWTMTPSSFNDNNARLWVVFSNGSLNPNAWADHSHLIRPVIALNANTLHVTGNGTAGSPYVIGEAIRVVASTNQSSFLINEVVNIKNHLTVTRRVNGVPTVIPANNYDVDGFATNTLGENRSFTVTYDEITVPMNYNVRPDYGNPVGDGTGAEVVSVVIAPTQMTVTFRFNGQANQVWYVYSANIEDMFRPVANQQPRTNIQTTGNWNGIATITAPRDGSGNLLKGYYYFYIQRNGNNDDAYRIVAVK